MSKACGKPVTSAKIALRKKISRHRDNIVGKGLGTERVSQIPGKPYLGTIK